MSGGRFAKARLTPDTGHRTPDTEAPAPPPALRRAEPRTPLGVRAKPSLQANLTAVVEEYKGRGWDVGHHTLLEHWLRRMGDPAYAQAFMLDLARGGDSEG